MPKTFNINLSQAIASISGLYSDFLSKIAELQERQGKGSKFLNIEGQEMQIQRLVALEERQAKPTFEDMNLIKRRAMLNIESHGQALQKLVKVGTNLRYVPVEEMFDVISYEHKLTAHGGRDIMHDKLKRKYANVTIAIVKNFVDSCLNCSLKKRALRTAANVMNKAMEGARASPSAAATKPAKTMVANA